MLPGSPGADEGLSCSLANLLTIPSPLRRGVLWHPLQDQKCRPWPTPNGRRLGSPFPHDHAAGFTSSYGPASRSPPTKGTLSLRFDAGLSTDAGSRATGDPGVSPDRTLTGWPTKAYARLSHHNLLTSGVPNSRTHRHTRARSRWSSNSRRLTGAGTGMLWPGQVTPGLSTGMPSPDAAATILWS
jgi:hypothetical protein